MKLLTAIKQESSRMAEKWMWERWKTETGTERERRRDGRMKRWRLKVKRREERAAVIPASQVFWCVCVLLHCVHDCVSVCVCVCYLLCSRCVVCSCMCVLSPMYNKSRSPRFSSSLSELPPARTDKSLSVGFVCVCVCVAWSVTARIIYFFQVHLHQMQKIRKPLIVDVLGEAQACSVV